ncbi:uncharacterized protein LOC100212026 isoform X2 [Hydra vulgaris]|uniref:Uncharacterized protein LOC100212026 isoform X2 n=1 Tax=Hydra vulgaris TaxID=6087 RepID=A0ABM4D2L0_HYDVU
MACNINQKMSLWARVVWEENDNSQFEDVIPAHWVNEDIHAVFWPSKMSVQRAIIEQVHVDKTWHKFKWVKTKIVNEDKQLCIDFPSGSEVKSTEDKIDCEKAAAFATSTESSFSNRTLLDVLISTVNNMSNHHSDGEQIKTKRGLNSLDHIEGLTPKKKSKNEVKDFSIVVEEMNNTVCLNNTNKDGFPMSEANFQKKTLSLLAEIRDELRKMINTSSPPSSIKICKINDIPSLETVNNELKDPIVRKNAIEKLRSVGGDDYGEMVRNILDRLFSVSVMTMLNMKGSCRHGKKKIAFKSLEFFEMIQEVVTERFKHATTKNIALAIANKLKNAPGQFKRDQSDIK